jgi:16S rRNA (cytosine1402-N4)-methyltransferase
MKRSQGQASSAKKGRKAKEASGRESSPADLERTARSPLDAAPADPDQAAPAAALHSPVLLQEVLSFYEPQSGQRLLDATLGLGGHSEALLTKAREAGAADVALLGLDRDREALALAAERLAPFGAAAHTAHSVFSECGRELEALGWRELDFVLADIGVSSLQLDSPERGFSFRQDGELDMRMNRFTGRSARKLINEAPVSRLREIIADYGEEPMAARIAKAIDDARSAGEITGTLQLARIVEMAYPAKWRAKARNHPATRTFQALRMAVNDELGELEMFLRTIVPYLRPGGRIAVITFHSLEDRLVKHFFREEATGCICPKQVPVCVCGHTASLKVLTRKPITASATEAAANPRAASAKLRVAEKLGPTGGHTADQAAERTSHV